MKLTNLTRPLAYAAGSLAAGLLVTFAHVRFDKLMFILAAIVVGVGCWRAYMFGRQNPPEE